MTKPLDVAYGRGGGNRVHPDLDNAVVRSDRAMAKRRADAELEAERERTQGAQLDLFDPEPA
jgi:hypothetical protein